MALITTGEYALFSQTVTHVRLLNDLFVAHECKRLQRASNSLLRRPELFVFTQAIALCLYTSGLKATHGHAFVGCRPGGLVSVANHAWLTWRNEYIIDVLPTDGVFGVSVPQTIFPLRGIPRFLAYDTRYPREWKEKQQRVADQDIEQLAALFDELLDGFKDYQI